MQPKLQPRPTRWVSGTLARGSSVGTSVGPDAGVPRHSDCPNPYWTGTVTSPASSKTVADVKLQTPGETKIGTPSCNWNWNWKAVEVSPKTTLPEVPSSSSLTAFGPAPHKESHRWTGGCVVDVVSVGGGGRVLPDGPVVVMRELDGVPVEPHAAVPSATANAQATATTLSSDFALLRSRSTDN